MKHMKTILALCLSALCLFSFLVPAFAAVQGDADGDNAVTPADARLVLRFSIGLEMIDPMYLLYCDMDNDAYITPADARLVLRLAVGLDLNGNPTTPQPTQPQPTQPQEQPTNPAPAKSEKASYIENLIAAVNTAEILDNMKIFTEQIGARWYASDNMDKGRGWVKGILRAYGYDDSATMEDPLTCNDVTVYNVCAKIPTAVSNPDIILFVAHYDSYYEGCGAVDNASGLCTVLEIARVLKSLHTDFGVEIRFLFSAAEEMGYYGAYRYINSCSADALNRHVAVFNVDMSAHFKNAGNPYLTVSTRSAYGSNAQANRPSRAVDDAKAIVGSCGEYRYRNPVAAGLHDLIPFEKALNNKGMPALTLSWREINYDHSYGSQDGLAAPAQIHSSADTLSNLDLDSLYATTRLAVGAAASLVYDYVK